MADGPEPFVPAAHSLVKRAINREYRWAWQTRWEQRKDVKQSRLMMPEVDKTRSKLLTSYTRKDLQLLAQVQTGHCLLGRHLNKWKAISPICRLCEGGLESPHHLLEECNALALEQMYFWDRVIRGNLREAMLLRFFQEEKVRHLFYGNVEDV